MLCTLKPEMVSATVGTSGALGSRVLPVTAMGLSLPDLMWGMDENNGSISSGTRPAITSVYAGPLPLYGMCSMSMPVMFLSSSPVRCMELPLPGDA